MANIFSVRPGVTLSLQNLDAVPVTFGLAGWGGYGLRRSIIQSIQVSSQGSFQFLTSLQNFTYVYVFGERPGEMTLSGITFRGDCSLLLDGWSAAMSYYADFALSSTGSPLGVQIGSSGFYGFLVGASFQLTKPEWNLGQFSFKMITAPP